MDIFTCSRVLAALAATMGVIDTPAVKKTTVVKWIFAMAMIFVVVLFGSTLPRRQEAEGAIEHALEEVEEALGIVEDDDGEAAAASADAAPADAAPADAAPADAAPADADAAPADAAPADAADA